MINDSNGRGSSGVANAYEVLKVIDRALRSIADDLQKAIDDLDSTLAKMKEENVQQD